MSELHLAVILDQPDVVESILSQYLVDIHVIDENGDQAAHIAARLNRVDCMKLLIEYDARMGRKNFSGLTPLVSEIETLFATVLGLTCHQVFLALFNSVLHQGEAQMNNHTDVATLIKDNYATDESHQYIWNEEINRECAAWWDSWDDEKQCLQWVRIGPHGNLEVSATPPPISIQRIIENRQKYGERNVVRRIHPGSLLSQQQLQYERKKEMEKQALLNLMKSRAAIVEERCATKLQAQFRKLKAAKLAQIQRIQRSAADRIQRRCVDAQGVSYNSLSN
jgi:hypothetical protein